MFSMELFETRKVGKHLFIFVKEIGENGSAKEQTFIKTCSSTGDCNKLPSMFMEYLRRFFDMLDKNNTGFIKLSDVEAHWGKINGGDSVHSCDPLKHVRRVTSDNGLLNFELFCEGIGEAMNREEAVSMPNHSRSSSVKNGQNFVSKDGHLSQRFENHKHSTCEDSILSESGVRKRKKNHGDQFSTCKNERTKSSLLSTEYNGKLTDFISKKNFSESDICNGYSRHSMDERDPEVNNKVSRNSTKSRPKSVTFQDDVMTSKFDELARYEKKRGDMCMEITDEGFVTEQFKHNGIVERTKQFNTSEVMLTCKGVECSDNEACSRRSKHVLPTVRYSGNHLNDDEMNDSKRVGERCRLTKSTPPTKVFYKGHMKTSRKLQLDARAHFQTTPKREQEEATKITTANEELVLRNGLRAIDEIKHRLLRRISQIEEKKLYEKLQINSDIGGKTLEAWNNFTLEALSSHFHGLLGIMKEAKRPLCKQDLQQCTTNNIH
ncbi:uncharacterized protein LOC124439525 isoform X2 [Xenia sp. Carnegie-2017]|uniref:uncharacterized protein LOC124439525 isoform X2 n=1 Tax=Xenia sp. Carnegie-2017 TaxID=2897299 RepID=UPI001F046A10|nr:uncharacterized protein LOC124439525 isoform X2 [Xenia sp. Carnegie-2017]